MFELEGEAFIATLIGGCTWPDWEDEWDTPYEALADTLQSATAAELRNTVELLRGVALRPDDELLASLRRFHCYHDSAFEAHSARRLITALADYVETGARDPEFERTTPREPDEDDEAPLVEDLEGAWTVSSSFDDIEQANEELTLAIRAKPELVTALANHERPDIPTMRVRMAEPLGKVILNDGRIVRGRTAVAVARIAEDGTDYIHTGYLEAEVDDEPDPREDYPLLHLFLDGYLHQDWRDDYERWEMAFGDYKLNRTADEREQLLQEIARIRALSPEEQTSIIVRCHSYLVPSREGFDDGQWLNDIDIQSGLTLGSL